MKVNIFTVADSVNVYEDGKLVISGTFDNIRTDKCPFMFRPFGVAIKLRPEQRDYGKQYESKLVLKKVGRKKAIFEMPLQLKFSKKLTKKITNAVASVMIGGAVFDSFGEYVLALRVGSDVISDLRLNVIKAESPKKKPRKTKKTAKKSSKAKHKKKK